MNPTNIELLRLAKELAYSDYNNRKAELHNQWLAESDLAWKRHRLKVAYPPIPPFPTEQEIMDRALNLIEFLNTPRPDLEEPKEKIKEAVTAGDSIEQPEQEPKQEPKQEDIKETVQAKQPQFYLPPEQDLDYARLKIEKRQETGTNRELVSSLIQKLNSMKNAWK